MLIQPVQNFARVDVGKNSIGKTPTQIFDAITYQHVYPDKEYVVFEGQGKWYDAHTRGHFRIDWLIPQNSTTWAEQLQEFTEPTPGNKIYKHKDAVLIIDDITLALSYYTQKSFLGLFALRPSPRYNMQMFLNCHEPRNIPEGIKGYPTQYHIYANEASASQFEDKISCHLQCTRASLVINKYEKLYPGYYDVRTHTPYFPHIVVYKDNPEPLHCVNMDYEKAKPILEEFTKQAA